MKAMSLRMGKTEQEVNEVRQLSIKLDNTMELVEHLVKQLTELRDEVGNLFSCRNAKFEKKINFFQIVKT